MIDLAEALFQRSVLYRAGQIVPHRIVRFASGKKYQHMLVFGTDTRIVYIGGKYLVGADVRDGKFFVQMKKRPSRIKKRVEVVVQNIHWIPWEDSMSRQSFVDDFFYAYCRWAEVKP